MSKLVKGSGLAALTTLVALVLAVPAFGAPAKSTTTSLTTTVGVTAGKPSEFAFTLSRKTARKGTVVFKLVNRGAIAHDFKIAGKKTPHVAPGKAATLKVVFTKTGKFPYLCTLPSHAAAGMKGVFTVKP